MHAIIQFIFVNHDGKNFIRSIGTRIIEEYELPKRVAQLPIQRLDPTGELYAQFKERGLKFIALADVGVSHVEFHGVFGYYGPDGNIKLINLHFQVS